jgi:hypothetical protein
VSSTETIHGLPDIERALDASDDRTRIAVLQLIAQHPDAARTLTHAGRDVIDVLVAFVDREAPGGARTTALATLAALGREARTIDRMAQEVGEAHGAYEHMIGLGYLAQYAPARARPFARKLLFGPTRDGARLAARLLGNTRDLDVRERVRLHAVEPQPAPFAWSSEALSRLIDELAGDFHAGARELISAHHPELIPALAERWRQLDEATRGWLVDAAEGHPDPLAVGSLLTQALADEAASVRERALRLLARRGVTRFDLAPERLRPFLGGEPIAWAHAVRAAATPEEANALLADSATPREVRIAALARCGDLSDATWIAHLEHPAWQVRSAAAEALARRDDLSAWLGSHYATLSEAGRIATARAALDARVDDRFEEILFTAPLLGTNG